MRDSSHKLGIPAIHSRLPDGPNLEYDDGQAYIQELVFQAEYDFGELCHGNRNRDGLDWSNRFMHLYGDLYRTESGWEAEEKLRDHKRMGE